MNKVKLVNVLLNSNSMNVDLSLSRSECHDSVFKFVKLEGIVP